MKTIKYVTLQFYTQYIRKYDAIKHNKHKAMQKNKTKYNTIQFNKKQYNTL